MTLSKEEQLYRIANHIASAKGGLPDEWQPWADEIESDLRRLVSQERDKQEPVAYIAFTTSGLMHGVCEKEDPVKMEWLKRGFVIQPLYAASSSATISNYADIAIDEASQVTAALNQTHVKQPASNSPEIPDGWVILPAEPTHAMMNAWLSEIANWRGHAAGYRAMIAAAPKQEYATDKTTQQFESLGYVVTSDERKMEIPRCSKHPEITLQTNPFELLMSYPPRPVMYCSECEPWVAERVENDKQLRHKRMK